MRLIIRKPDSATSILLFVFRFNAYFNRTMDYSMKLSSILRIMVLFGKNESSVRMALSRASKSGFMTSIKKAGEVYYTPSFSAIRIIDGMVREMNCLFERVQLRNKIWDKKWFCVISKEADALVKEKWEELNKSMQSLGLYSVTKSMWISPYNLSKYTNDMAADPESGSGFVTIYGDLSLKETNECFIKDIFKLDKLQVPYGNFITIFKRKLTEIMKFCESGHRIPDNLSVPLFYELGSALLDNALQDPFIPQELMPDWEGQEALSIAERLFELITPAVRLYFTQNSQK